jgi:hypothetical protein
MSNIICQHTIVALSGTIRSITLDQDPRFILSNDDGLFSVHLQPQEVPNLTLQQDTEICVVGRLTTYYDRRHQIHKFIVQAALVTPINNENTWKMMVRQATNYYLGLAA